MIKNIELYGKNAEAYNYNCSVLTCISNIIRQNGWKCNIWCIGRASLPNFAVTIFARFSRQKTIDNAVKA